MNRAVLTAVVIVVVVAAGWWLFRRGSGRARRSARRSSTRRQKSGGAVHGRRRDAGRRDASGRSLAPPNGRLTFRVKVPDDGWLKVSLGTEAGGVGQGRQRRLFFAGVSDGRAFEKLFEQTLNPFANPSERRWIPVTVDLSALRRRGDGHHPQHARRAAGRRAGRRSQRHAAVGRPGYQSVDAPAVDMAVPLLDLQGQYAAAARGDPRRDRAGLRQPALHRRSRGRGVRARDRRAPRRRRTRSACRRAPTRCWSR